MGCDGCELWMRGQYICYAGRAHQLRGGQKGYAPTFDEVTLFPGRMAAAAHWSDLTEQDRPEKPWLNGLPRLIFVSDMSDALSAAVSFEYLRDEIIDVVTGDEGWRHVWQWLTKRPQRMAEFSRWLSKQGIRWPRNLWVGTSVTTQSTTSRVAQLLKVGNRDTIRFLSVEPQWEGIDLRQWLPSLDWVIQGGQSGNIKRSFDLAWADELIQQCRRLKVPYFLKQLGGFAVANGSRLQFDDYHGGDWSEWPQHLRVRQMPAVD
jgi:protein gp37